MKLTIPQEQLVNGLMAVQNVVGSRTTLPILSNVLLRARADRLELTATDLDVTISCPIAAKVDREGATTLPVKKLLGIVKELSGFEIELDVDERHHCTVQASSAFFKLHGLPPEEFPPLPTFGESQRFVLPQEKVKTMLRRTAFAASTDEARYVLNGIFLSVKDHKVIMVATDGRRLALAEEDLDTKLENPAEFIIPTKAINELGRLLRDQGDLEVAFTENQAAFLLREEKGFNVLVISKLVEGNYPNYRQVIPAESKERVPLVRDEFLAALRRADVMTSEKSNSVKLTFARNSLSITANTPEVGEARVSVAMSYKGKDIAVAFNPTFLMDALNAVDNDEVFFELTDELSPGVVKINGPFLYVIMPMRTN